MATTNGNWETYNWEFENRCFTSQRFVQQKAHKKCNETCMLECPLKNQYAELGKIKEVEFEIRKFYYGNVSFDSSAI